MSQLLSNCEGFFKYFTNLVKGCSKTRKCLPKQEQFIYNYTIKMEIVDVG